VQQGSEVEDALSKEAALVFCAVTQSSPRSTQSFAWLSPGWVAASFFGSRLSQQPLKFPGVLQYGSLFM